MKYTTERPFADPEKAARRLPANVPLVPGQPAWG